MILQNCWLWQLHSSSNSFKTQVDRFLRFRSIPTAENNLLLSIQSRNAEPSSYLICFVDDSFVEIVVFMTDSTMGNVNGTQKDHYIKE